MAAAQTVTAAVCCQTLRGEEGKKNKHEVMDCFFFNKSKTLQINPPFSFLISRAVVSSLLGHDITVCKMNGMCFILQMEVKRKKKTQIVHVQRGEGDILKAQQERVARLCSCPAAACQRAPVGGSFGTAVTRNRLESQQLRNAGLTALQSAHLA